MAIYDFTVSDYLLENPNSGSQQVPTDSKIAIYNAESPEHSLARKMGEEAINISGAPVIVYIRTENGDYDAVWDEDPDPTYWAPFDLKAYFKPKPIELELKKWGLESENKIEVVFSHKMLLEKVGTRLLRAGDVLVVPYNSILDNVSPHNYRITNAAPSGYYRYEWLYLTCQATVISQDITVKPDINDDQTQIQTGDDMGFFLEST